MKKIVAPTRARTPRATPTPIPALAPGERPGFAWGWDDVGRVDAAFVACSGVDVVDLVDLVDRVVDANEDEEAELGDPP